MGLFFLPFYMFLVAFFLALRERSGRRQPPAERSSCNYYFPAMTIFPQLLGMGGKMVDSKRTKVPNCPTYYEYIRDKIPL